jgi:4-hydroxybenzoate polyprenyltransferase
MALVLWTVIFDTLYAHQDYTDDKKAGIHGLAVRLGQKGTKPTFFVLTSLQVACLVAAGRYAGFGWAYFTLACIGTGGCLMFMIGNVRLEEGSSCAWWFGPGSRFVGIAISSGLLAEFIANHYPLAFMG